MKTLAFTLLAGFALASAAFTQSNPSAGQQTCTAKSQTACTAEARPAALKDCPTTEKVVSLLGKWKTAATPAEMTPEAREKLTVKMANVASQCPVGSRLGETLTAVRDTVAFVAASQAECAGACPLEKMDAGAPDIAVAKELKNARTYLVARLNDLAGYAAEACPKADAACCASSAKTAGREVAAKTGCDATQTAVADCSSLSSCPIRIASRLGAAKASFAAARKEAASMTGEARAAITKGFGEMAQANPAVSLMPESVMALAEGLKGLQEVDAKMGAFAEAHPQMFADLPNEARMSFMVQTSLIEEASQLLAAVTETMAAMQANTGEKTAALR